MFVILMHLKGVRVLAVKDQLRHTTNRKTEDFYIGSDLDHQREQIEKLAIKRFKGLLKGTPEDSETTVEATSRIDDFRWNIGAI
jgi:hypothetical protein